MTNIQSHWCFLRGVKNIWSCRTTSSNSRPYWKHRSSNSSSAKRKTCKHSSESWMMKSSEVLDMTGWRISARTYCKSSRGFQTTHRVWSKWSAFCFQIYGNWEDLYKLSKREKYKYVWKWNIRDEIESRDRGVMREPTVFWECVLLAAL